jgi:hypothetical protein
MGITKSPMLRALSTNLTRKSGCMRMNSTLKRARNTGTRLRTGRVRKQEILEQKVRVAADRRQLFLLLNSQSNRD